MANNQLLASDNFASGSLAAGWSAAPTVSVCQVVSGSPNVTEPNALSTIAGQIWTGKTWPTDQISEVTVQTLTSEANTFLDLFVRLQSGVFSGYGAVITNGTAQIARWDNSVETMLSSAVSGLTFASGDVWTFAAAGCVLTLYQNGNHVVRYMDTTYTSGFPGYLQQSNVNLTHTQVSSWRGYSAVQQDGVWQKQGIVVPAIAGDIGSGAGGQANTTMLHEGNAQVLSGVVYKMWFSAGTPTAESNIYYAESLDGINWTRHVGAVISGQGSPFIIKNGSTYYLYTQPLASAGVGNFSVYTSTDGINWTSQATNILGALGGSGVWDGVVQWYFQPVAIIGGTWYAVYSGANNSTTYQLKIGLATSPDGVTWTKSASNPVLTAANGGSVVNSCALANVNGTYYMWMFGMQPGQNGTPPLLNPGEGVLYSTTDFVHWSFVHHSVHRGQLYEGLNFPTGQCYPNSIFTVGGKTYLYIQSATSDNSSPAEYQISLAIAPAPISSVVLFSEDGTSQVQSDNFNRGSLGSNWTTPTGANAIQIASNLAEGSTTAACIGAFTGASFSNNQYAECTLQTLAASSGESPTVRVQTGSVGYYAAGVSGPFGTLNTGVGAVAIYKNVAGTFTKIGGATMAYTPQQNDVWRLQAITGSDGFPILSLFQNGFLVLQVEDYSNAFPFGVPGLYISPTTSIANAQVSSWAGGNANVIPNYPPSGGSWLQANRDFANKRGVRGN